MHKLTLYFHSIQKRFPQNIVFIIYAGHILQINVSMPQAASLVHQVSMCVGVGLYRLSTYHRFMQQRTILYNLSFHYFILCKVCCQCSVNFLLCIKILQFYFRINYGTCVQALLYFHVFLLHLLGC